MATIPTTHKIIEKILDIIGTVIFYPSIWQSSIILLLALHIAAEQWNKSASEHISAYIVPAASSPHTLRTGSLLR
jgi:hypothetical protein